MEIDYTVDYANLGDVVMNIFKIVHRPRYIYIIMQGVFETVPSGKLPDKASSLAERSYWAQVNMPRNAAHLTQIALAADKGEKYQFRSDELIHGFARSRTDANNPVQTWRAELFIQPVHNQTGPNAQYPDDMSRYISNQRITRYQQIAPVMM